MGDFINTFTFDRNTFRRTNSDSAESVAAHIAKVSRGDELDKTASNTVGALASYMGIFAKVDSKFVPTKAAEVFLKLYAGNKPDSWRWLVTRSLWRFVVPNGTNCKVNGPAANKSTRFAFFHSVLQLLTHLSAQSGDDRHLYFEELCQLLADDATWKLNGGELFARLMKARSGGNNGFRSARSFLEDLENSLSNRSEFDIPRDNFNDLFLKAFSQTGFFQFRDGTNGKTVAVALNPNLDHVLQRRLRFILDHPPIWNGADWSGYMDIQASDLPQEVTIEAVDVDPQEPIVSPELKELIPAAKERVDAAKLIVPTELLLRFVSALESKRFLILTGLAGSGKTKLAQGFARWITPEKLVFDVFAQGAQIASERTIYYVNKSDDIAVEFWNAENEEEATKVTIPREMIAEWAAFIEANALTEQTPARKIRESVKGTSKFSDQLHSFETHLKAAAFALVKSKAETVHESCYALIAVGADWTGNENIVGYPNGLEKSAFMSKPSLDLILHSKDHLDIPHFLILDEMNLSHVERYFADILSAIESEEKIHLHNDKQRKANSRTVPAELALPKNLFIIGTVNVDETTYMFSPKVLDRANVIEFRMEAGELESFLSNPAKPDLSKLDGKGASFGKAFVEAAKTAVDVPAEVKQAYEAEMLLLFKALQVHGAEFGYRTAHEAARFIYFYKLFGNHAGGDVTWFSKAFDCVVFQKLLPKLHASRAKLGPLLKVLWFLCVNDAAGRGADALKAAETAARSTDKKAEPSAEAPAGAPYPLSAAKIGRMWRLLRDNGFASFAEA